MKKILAMAAALVLSSCTAVSANNGIPAFQGIVDVQDIDINQTYNDIDWNKVPSFDNQFDLVMYLRNTALDLIPVVPVKLTNGYMINNSDVLFLANLLYMSTKTESTDDPNTNRAILSVAYTHGERVLYAYQHGDTSFLTGEEMQLYNKAVQIVNEANNFAAGHSNPELYKELYIHDAITESTVYYTEAPIPSRARFLSAIGVFIDGKANCSGYSDAFYMLGNMCGLNVQKVSLNNYDYTVSHAVNIITLGGKNYFVDTTADDATFSSTAGEENNYIYFNTSADIVAASYQWSRDYYPTVVENPDNKFYYGTEEFYRSGEQYFGARASSAEEALDLIAEQFSKGRRIARAFAPEEDTYKDSNRAMRYVLDQLPRKYGWQGSISMNISWRAGKYMFFSSEGARTN